MVRLATLDTSAYGPPPFWYACRRWARLARLAGRILAGRTATMDDYRMWNASAVRYGYGDHPGLPLSLDLRARWWLRWMPWW